MKQEIHLLYFDGKCLSDSIDNSPIINSFDEYYKKLKDSHNILYDMPIQDLLIFFNEVSKKIIERDGIFQKKFSDEGINLEFRR